MSVSLFTVTLYLTLGAGPFGFGNPGCSSCGTGGAEYYGGGSYGGGGYVSGGSGGYYEGGYTSSSSGSADPLFPFDSPEPWLHGYYQQMPAYAGYHKFLPYNYKHVLAQSQAAGGWGMSPNMPYSQQWWHRYQQRSMMKQRVSQTLPDSNNTSFVNVNGRVEYSGVNVPVSEQPYATTSVSQEAGLATGQPLSQAELQQQLRQRTIELQALQNALQQQQRSRNSVPQRKR